MKEENKDLIIQQLLEKFNELYKKVEKLEKDIPTSEELSQSTKENKYSNVPFNQTKKMKRGKGSQPLMESEILEAQKDAKSASEVARKLGVCMVTYMKYAKMYGIYENVKNPTGKGITKHFNPRKGKYPLDDILAGKHPNYPIYRLKDKLIRSGYKPAHCEQCGFNERRITDGKIPLLLVFEDNNSKNHNIDNLTILCYNCSFTSGKLWTRCKDRYYKVLNNPDRILGASVDTKQLF